MAKPTSATSGSDGANARSERERTDEKTRGPALTTNQGVPVADPQDSLRAGPRGPALLEDFILREKITHFDHERIPERIVHARGTGAHGYFELTESLQAHTRARVLTEVGVRTPVFARFSTVAGGAGSADTPRDVRGFAVKFYTAEGNWDLVGNNVPVFFIQDAIKFPDLVHALKMEPDRGFPQSASAHDTFWDFISLTPESWHMVLWAMSDRTLPRSLRMIEGFGVHSFRLLNDRGASTFVKFHWRPHLGLQSTLWDEAVKIAGADPDFHRRDLWQAIQNGERPGWDFGVQLFTEQEAAKFPFDHLDPTKLIPEELVPVRIIGRMILDRMPDNFFAETEQVAFCPAHLIPGLDFTNDPLLQGRLFSYTDTQLSRLGTPNFHQLPINAPKCPFHHYRRDGQGQMSVPKGRVSYEPNSLEPQRPLPAGGGFRSFPETPAGGEKGRRRPERFDDHYSQARWFFQSQSRPDQTHLVSALIFELSKVETAAIRRRVLEHLEGIEETLARRVAAGLGEALPPRATSPLPLSPLAHSTTVQTAGKMKATLEGRSVAVLVHDGSDRRTINAIRRALTKEGATVKVIAPRIGEVLLQDRRPQIIDGQLAGHPSVLFDAIAVVLTRHAALGLSKDCAALEFVRDAYAHLKAIYADSGGAALLGYCGIDFEHGVHSQSELPQFLTAAKTRHWDRERKVRNLP